MKENLIVFYGGKSVEHDISIITALHVMKNISSEYNVIPVYISGDGFWYIADNLTDSKIYRNFDKLAKNKRGVTLIMGKPYLAVKKCRKYSKFIQVDCALLCNHGLNGEDGSLQGALELSSIPYTSCGIESSAVCMDKVFMKNILQANSINTPNFVYVKESSIDDLNRTVDEIVKKIKFPSIVKPANLGSSIGISVCKNKEDLKDAILVAFKFDDKVLVESVVKNLREFNCACMMVENNFVVSNVDEVELKSEIFSFDEKYLKLKDKKKDKIKASLKNKIIELTKKVYELFDCQGVVRIDYLYDEKEDILYVNELNTIPGSLALYLFKDVSAKEIIDCMILQAKYRNKDKLKRKYSFESDALNIFEKYQESQKLIKK